MPRYNTIQKANNKGADQTVFKSMVENILFYVCKLFYVFPCMSNSNSHLFHVAFKFSYRKEFIILRRCLNAYSERNSLHMYPTTISLSISAKRKLHGLAKWLKIVLQMYKSSTKVYSL